MGISEINPLERPIPTKEKRKAPEHIRAPNGIVTSRLLGTIWPNLELFFLQYGLWLVGVGLTGSSNECKRRKIKCNGQVPCQRCGHLNLECMPPMFSCFVYLEP